MNIDQIFHEALELPPTTRARLIEVLFDSFLFERKKEIEEAWEKEIKTRVQAIKDGKISSRPVKEILEEINQWK